MCVCVCVCYVCACVVCVHLCVYVEVSGWVDGCVLGGCLGVFWVGV